mgnify:FL=1|tara:strand:+ start:1163 stop:1624 length:462 start_codon:yes stop_codon:yes gene_type:complete
MTDMTGTKIMLLVANGFNQANFITMQREFMNDGAEVTVVSSEKNLVNGFNGEEWGLTFPVDQQIDEVLGSDFDAVIVIGGEQSISRLSENAHTARIMDAFVELEKPMVLLNEAQTLTATSSSHVMVINEVAGEETVAEIKEHIVSEGDLAQAA